MIRIALKKLDRVLTNLPSWALWLIALLIASGISWVDLASPAELLILQIAPILFAAWYGHPSMSGLVALVAAAQVFVVKAILEPENRFDASGLASFGFHLLIYMLVANNLTRLRVSMQRQQELSNFIVHDLRSPISSTISGLMTLEQTAQNLGESDREMVALSLVSSQRALSLVNSMLDVAKLESGRMQVHVESVELQPFLERSISEIALWARSHDVGLEIVSKLSKADFDPHLTARVLVNLLTNALKFSPSGSKVVMSVEERGPSVRFSVIDRGPGIPPEYVSSVFEPFKQVKGTKGGTGLGLTFCKLAIQAQGGKIWVESELGKGTAIRFEIPKNAARKIRTTQENGVDAPDA